MDSTSNLINSIGTMLTIGITSYFNFNLMYAIPLTQLINNILAKIYNADINYENMIDYTIFNTYYFLIVCVLPLLYYSYKHNVLYLYDKVNQFKKCIYPLTYEIYDELDMNVFRIYLEKYADHVEINSMQKGIYRNTGDHEDQIYTFLTIPDSKTKFRLDDIEGTFQILFVSTTRFLNLANQPVGKKDESIKSKQSVELPYIKIQLYKSISYSDFISKIKYKNKIYIDNRFIKLYGLRPKTKDTAIPNIEKFIFFEIERENYNKITYLSQYFSNNKKNIKKIMDTNSFNLMLYGPPGTGKSKLIEIIAKYKERNIICLDLKKLTKTDVNDYLISIYNIPCKKNIYVIEEFDQTYEYLKFKEQIYKDKLKTLTDAIKSDRDLVKYMTEQGDELFLGDLLEIFQSAIPREGQIIIVTTNNFDKMKEELPALFRPGRLTPIEITYLNQQTFDDMLKYYYSDEVNRSIILPSNHAIPTSQIIEFISISQTFEEFCELFQKLL